MLMTIVGGSQVDITVGKSIKFTHGYMPPETDGLFFQVINIDLNMPVIRLENGEEPHVTPSIIEEVI